MNTHTVRKSLWIASGITAIALVGMVSYGLSKPSEPKTELVPAVTIERPTTTMGSTTVKPKPVTTQRKIAPTTVPTTSTSQPTTTAGPATTVLNLGGKDYEVPVECQTSCPDKNAATSTPVKPTTTTTDNEANGDDTVNRGPNYLAPYQGK